MQNESSPQSISPAEQRLEPHRGGAVLALGILSVVLGFVGWILAIIAIVFARTDLRKMNSGEMDPAGRSLTQAGKVCGIVGLVWQVVIVGLMVLWLSFFLRMMSNVPKLSESGRSAMEEIRSSSRAFDVAAEEVRRRGWTQYSVHSPQKVKQGWAVMVRRLPEDSAQVCLITISDQGSIIEFVPGRLDIPEGPRTP